MAASPVRLPLVGSASSGQRARSASTRAGGPASSPATTTVRRPCVITSAGFVTGASAPSSTSGRPLVEEGALATVTKPADVITQGRRTVVVAGDDAGPPARVLAERARWPLLAEPTSGSRTGDAAIRTYRLLL